MKLANRTYDILKYIAIIALPAFSAFYTDVAPLWNLPYATAIPQTIDHFAVLLGALLIISTHNYYKGGGKNE